MKCFLFHDWDNWKEYTENFTVVYTGALHAKEVRGKSFKGSQLRQRRKCKKCGKLQDVKVRENQ